MLTSVMIWRHFLHRSRKLYVQFLYDRKKSWVVFYSCILSFSIVSLEITVGSFYLSRRYLLQSQHSLEGDSSLYRL